VRYFNADPGVTGRPLKVNGRALEIVGVAQPEFTGVRVEIEEDSAPLVGIPVSMGSLAARDAGGRPAPLASVPTFTLQIIGRLGPASTRADAQTEAAVLAPRLDPPGEHATPTRITVTPLGGDRGTAAELVAFMAVPAIVLLLACVNAANLLTSRASVRARDAALRLTLGATRWRLVRQLLIESVLLAFVAAAGGVVLTVAIVAVFEHYLPVLVHIDWRVLAFAAVIAVVTAVGFGLGPAMAAANRAGDLVSRLARRPRSRLRSTLIGLQAALSLALIATGWQFANAVRASAGADGLREPERLVFVSINVGKLGWPDADVSAYYERVAARVAQLPGITHVAQSCACNPWGTWAPHHAGGGLRVWREETAPDKAGSHLAMYAGGDLFGALELEMASGRPFRDEDRSGPVRAVVVNQPFADRYLGPAPIGRTLRIGGPRDTFATSRLVEVVGIVRPPTVRRTDSLPMIYYPAPLAGIPARTLALRFESRADSRLALVHSAVRELNADAPRPDIITAEQARWQRNSSRQFLAVSVSMLGVLALVLAAAGLYGVVSFVVTLRRQEIAVRMALGAEPSRVVGMIVRQALTPAAVGIVAGAGAAVAMGLIVRSRLYGSSLADPIAFGGAVTLLLAVLLAASVAPARRAARVDPMQALRAD
jgi:predicted permease